MTCWGHRGRYGIPVEPERGRTGFVQMQRKRGESRGMGTGGGGGGSKEGDTVKVQQVHQHWPLLER